MLKFFLLVSVLCFAGHSRVIYYKGNVLPVPFNAKLRYVVVNPPADFDPVYFEDAPDIETTTSTEANIKREICDESATNFGDCTDTTEDSVKTISFDITTESTTPAIEKECLYDCSDKCVLWDNRCQNNTDCPQCYQCSTEEFSVYKICKHVSRKNNTLSSTNGDFLFGSTTVEKITSPVTSPTFKYVDTTVYSTTFDADSENRDDLVPDDTTPTTFKKIETISPVIDPVSTSNKTDTTTKKIDKVEHVLTSTVESFPSSTFDTGSGSGDGKIPNDDEGDDDDYTETTERNNTAPTDLFLSNATTTTFKHVETATTMTTFNEIKTTTKKMDEDQSSTVLSSSFETGIGSGNGKIPDDNEGDDDDDDEFRGNIQRNNTASTDLFPSSTNITTLATENHIETTLTPLTNPVSNANKTTTKKIDDQNFLTSTVSSMTIDNGSESGDGKIPDDDDGGSGDGKIPEDYERGDDDTEFETTFPLTDPLPKFEENKTITKKIAQNEDDQQTTTNPRTSLPCSYISFEDQLAKVTIDGVPLVITHNNVSDLFPNTTIEEVWERCHQVEKRCLEENCYGQEVVTKQYPCGMISTNLHTGRMTIDGVLVTPENITRLLPNARYEDVWTQCYRPRTSPKINYPCYMISFDEQRSRATLDGVVEMVKDCFNYQPNKVCSGYGCNPITTPKSTGNGGGSHNGGGGKNNGGGGGSDEDYQYKDDDDDGNKDGDGSLKNFDDFIFLEKEINFK
ncbi:hypothetical protein TcasGA2_TC033999 [Tribolium castaneum]|uniref:Uncharacterized protein n=1 Tax=Tribolium castaneum TaxID=7070 RepID=A0A139WDZ0_TRICA|nr:hypothetical protein TcasGA2_TC033999 [Tribolium castaneum]